MNFKALSHAAIFLAFLAILKRCKIGKYASSLHFANVLFTFREQHRVYITPKNNFMQDQKYSVNWGGGDVHTFVFCPTNFFQLINPNNN